MGLAAERTTPASSEVCSRIRTPLDLSPPLTRSPEDGGEGTSDVILADEFADFCHRPMVSCHWIVRTCKPVRPLAKTRSDRFLIWQVTP